MSIGTKNKYFLLGALLASTPTVYGSDSYKEPCSSAKRAKPEDTTPLFVEAFKEENPKAVEELLKTPNSAHNLRYFDFVTPSEGNALHVLATKKDTISDEAAMRNIFEQLLKAGIDPRCYNKTGFSDDKENGLQPISLAAKYKHPFLLELLAEKGIRPDTITLHFALDTRNYGTVERYKETVKTVLRLGKYTDADLRKVHANISDCRNCLVIKGTRNQRYRETVLGSYTGSSFLGKPPLMTPEEVAEKPALNVRDQNDLDCYTIALDLLK